MKTDFDRLPGKQARSGDKRRFCCLCLLCLLTMMLCSCQSSAGEQRKTESYPPAEYERLSVADDLQLQEGEEKQLCYCDADRLIFAIGPRNGASNGPLNATRRLVEYDLRARKVRAQYEENAFWTICSAAPYQDGIVYVYYESMEVDAGGEDGQAPVWRMRWQIRYQRAAGTGEKQILDFGICDSWWDAPRLFCLEEATVFLYTDEALHGEAKTMGLKRIAGGQVERIAEYAHYTLEDSTVETNGTHYVFAAEDKAGGACLLVGDLKGLCAEMQIDERLNSFGINEKEAFYSSIWGDNRVAVNRSSFFGIDLQKGQAEKRREKVRPYYRLTGSGESLVCVDSGFNFYTVNAASGELQTLEIPAQYREPGTTVAIGAFSLGDDRYMVMFNEDEWLMRLR